MPKTPDPGKKSILKRRWACYDIDMSTVSLEQLQQNTSDLLDRVEAGEHLLVVRGGRPVAEMWPVASPLAEPRSFGLCRDEFSVPDDFDVPLPQEILREFEGQ